MSQTGGHRTCHCNYNESHGEARGGGPARPPAVDAPPAASKTPNQVQNRQKRTRRKKNTGGLLGRTAPAATAAGCNDWSPTLIREHQENDPDISEAITWVENGQRPPWQAVLAKSPMLRSLWRQFDSLVLRDAVLCRIFHSNNGTAKYYQTVMPRTLRLALLELIHADAAAHLKLATSLAHLQRRAWWLEWRRDMAIFIQNCGKCEAYHRGPPPKQAFLRPMPMGAPSQRWSIDLVGPFAMSNGYKFVFTAIDVFTKFVVAVPIRNKEAQTVAKVIVERIFLPWGMSTQLLSDCGREFENEILTEICRLLGVHKIRTSGYRPQSNGAIERWHRGFNSMLAKIVSEQQTDWSSYVAYVVACYNASVHSATGFSPFFLMTGRDPKWSVDLLLSGTENGDTTLPQYVQDVRERL